MGRQNKLKRELKLFDVYAICTGAMFSSGFFLLPGIASAEAGPSVILAYFFGGVMVLPAMLSAAELSTALPRAGGPYYFLDRSLGPMVGTVAGLGTWFALIFKSAFALVGMGAYLNLFFDFSVTALAVSLTILFMLMNIVGVKKTSGLQNMLVVLLVGILILFVFEGLRYMMAEGITDIHATQMDPIMPFGWDGLFATIGLVFVSYAGLTQVSSVAEEVQNPEWNIPLGMILSLLTATTIYVLGVYILVGVIDAEVLREDLTPVATASEIFFDIYSPQVGLLLVVVAAIAAFASTGNAGIMSAARYPLAMARDQLIWNKLSQVGRFNTPTLSIVLTSAAMIFFILVLDVEAIAKLASAFMLLIFGLLNLAVVVMRESHIETYDPGFNTPLYPWTQIIGISASVFLIVQIGILSILFTLGVVLACIFWYLYFAKDRVHRDGAIYHIFERLGRRRYEELDKEMLSIMKEKGLREGDPFDQVIARAHVIDMKKGYPFDKMINQAARSLSDRLPTSAEELAELLPTSPDELIEGFIKGTHMGGTPIANGVAMPHMRIHSIKHPEMVLVRCREGLHPKVWDEWYSRHEVKQKVYAVIFLVSPDENPAQHLRLLSQFASRVEDNEFLYEWLSAENEQQLKEILLRDDRFYSIVLDRNKATSVFIGKKVKELDILEGGLIAMINRNGHIIVPTGNTDLKDEDRLTIIGDERLISRLYVQFGRDGKG